jgi:hypothetical protein
MADEWTNTSPPDPNRTTVAILWTHKLWSPQRRHTPGHPDGEERAKLRRVLNTVGIYGRCALLFRCADRRPPGASNLLIFIVGSVLMLLVMWMAWVLAGLLTRWICDNESQSWGLSICWATGSNIGSVRKDGRKVNINRKMRKKNKSSDWKSWRNWEDLVEIDFVVCWLGRR